MIVMKLRFLVVVIPALLLVSCGSKKSNTLFDEISSSHSGITFNNTIVENDTINPLKVVNIYNGGGAGIGDFNNDGLLDIYFTGNQVSSKLYLNKGDFKFRDVTEEAGAEGKGRWARGVSVVDINADGWQDLYICNTIDKDSSKRVNILYINEGTDKDGVPHFKDMAKEYGLDIDVQSTMGNFFDYDNDGDLDMFLTVNEASNNYDPSIFRQSDRELLSKSLSRLFRNDWDSVTAHPVFHDVSAEAGIRYEGFGHGATVCDINKDGWKDIYVADDFISSDILYINNHDGTFTNKSALYFKHTSFNSMGQDITDINNDGLVDVIALDMSPEDNYRKKMMLNANSYQTFQNFEAFGYQYQYVRNTLQLNQGPRVGVNDSIGEPVFSDIGFYSGIAQTDWSWTPLVADFDNDSYRDLIVTNGFPRDITDHDFIVYRKDAIVVAPTEQLLSQIPQVKLHNYAFRNKGDLTFSDETNSWGLSAPNYSSGAAYGDFDNDGAMDMVINLTNDKSAIYRNTSRDKDTSSSHFLNIQFKGEGKNRNGIGAIATIYYDNGKVQVYENTPYRGYLSSVQPGAHFGLGRTIMVDSVVIEWGLSKKQIITNIKADQLITVSIADAREANNFEQPLFAINSLFKDITPQTGLIYEHRDFDFPDFNVQKLLPHKLSEYCPALAVGDLNSDGLDDMVIGGNQNRPAQYFLQQSNGKFVQHAVAPADKIFREYKDEGIILFDANGDKKLDIYIASGGYKLDPGEKGYQDRLYINEGKEFFREDTMALPKNYDSKLCVRAMDYNKDGKWDLFVSGRVQPWAYPKPVSSIILRNDSRNGVAKFTDVTKEIAPELINIGLVCDALVTDFDNDDQPDLLLAGEWMPLTFLKNNNGKFSTMKATGIDSQFGWWNSIVAGDFRGTGRMDYIIGNTGLNTLYRASDQYPVYVTAKDFDNNGSYAVIPSLYLPDQKGEKKEYPAHGRDDLIKQMISFKKKYTNYKSFANATMEDILTPEQRKGALRLKVNQSQSCYIRNDGNGKFTMIPLPFEAQVSALNGMVADDFDADGNLDVLINGNDYGTEVAIGRYDALNGLLLKGDGKGNFKGLTILQSGIFIPGNGKALVKLVSGNGNYLAIASQYRGPLKVFELKKKVNTIKITPDDISAMITFKNGTKRKEEFYFGSSFLSQSGRFMLASPDMVSAIIRSGNGIMRRVVFKP
jgi:hypothetical protein